MSCYYTKKIYLEAFDYSCLKLRRTPTTKIVQQQIKMNKKMQL